MPASKSLGRVSLKNKRLAAVIPQYCHLGPPSAGLFVSAYAVRVSERSKQLREGLGSLWTGFNVVQSVLLILVIMGAVIAVVVWAVRRIVGI